MARAGIPLLIGVILFWGFGVASPGMDAVPDTDRWIIEVDGKYGYIDRNGKEIIPPQFDDASDFSEGLAAVELGEEWGYVDPYGKWVVKPRFFTADAFSEGLALVEVETTGMSWYIDRTGRWAFKPRIVPLREETGEVIRQYLVGMSRFSEGLAVVIGGSSTLLYGYIDRNGNLVIPIKFREAQPFSEGLAGACASERAWKCGFIDRSGNWVIPPEFNEVYPFSAGLAAVRVGAIIRPPKPLEGGKWGFVDRSGKFVIPAEFEDVKRKISPDYPIAVKSEGKWGFVDRSGNWVIPPRYKWAEGFSEGLAAVHDGERAYYIDPAGRTVLAGPFTSGSSFRNGLAEARTSEGYGYIDRAGKWVWFRKRKFIRG